MTITDSLFVNRPKVFIQISPKTKTTSSMPSVIILAKRAEKPVSIYLETGVKCGGGREKEIERKRAKAKD